MNLEKIKKARARLTFVAEALMGLPTEKACEKQPQFKFWWDLVTELHREACDHVNTHKSLQEGGILETCEECGATFHHG